jgi:hypothetical protein
VAARAEATVTFLNPNEPLRSRIVPYSGSRALQKSHEDEKITTTRVSTSTATAAAGTTPRQLYPSQDEANLLTDPSDIEKTHLFELLWHSYTSETPVLKWGFSSGEYAYLNFAHTTTISRSQMCGWPANGTGWRDFGLIHTSLFDLTRLPPSPAITRMLYYKYGDAKTGDYSKEYIFYLPPLAGQTHAEEGGGRRPTTVGE